jgi:outer membrane protein
MKKLFLLLFLLVIPFSGLIKGQLKIGYVDSDSIMDKFADAQDARQKLDAIIQEWQTELTKLENNWKTKYDEYEKRKLIMSDQTRAETESELIKLEQQIGDYRE